MSEQLLRFGEKLIQLRLLTVDQVEQALQAQERARERGIDRSIGAWLHDQGLLDLVTIERVLIDMGYPPAYARVLPDIELRRLLGRGASGAVYHGWSHTLGEEVAVKVRASKGTHGENEEKRFRLEAQITERLNHPNIVRLFAAGETRDYVYHVFEYVEGRALDELLRERGKLTERELVDIGLQMASALAAAAAEGIVHRDIKPANIMIATTGRVKLCDLGLAKDTVRGPALTAEGMVLGSPYYNRAGVRRRGQARCAERHLQPGRDAVSLRLRQGPVPGPGGDGDPAQGGQGPDAPAARVRAVGLGCLRGDRLPHDAQGSGAPLPDAAGARGGLARAARDRHRRLERDRDRRRRGARGAAARLAAAGLPPQRLRARRRGPPVFSGAAATGPGSRASPQRPGAAASRPAASAQPGRAGGPRPR
ncbi:MAG: hypothetical protein KatS3mg102_1664 [Planctomycetota bacterium]|nr:MAG: hypothetical protein KatS3mg102_1664 [Planctomycetota bacterium]